MLIQKLWAIARKDLFTTFQDRNAILIMFAMPLAISLIIGLALGTGGDISIDAIPLAVANQDDGATIEGQTVNLGAVYEQVLLAEDDAADPRAQQVAALVDAVRPTDLAAARDAVEAGDLAALITIPAGFSQAAFAADGAGTVQVYYDSGRSVSPSVVSAILRAVTNGINTSILAQRAGPAALAAIGAAADADQSAIGQAQGDLSARITASQDPTAGAGDSLANPITLRQVNLQGETRSFDALQYFAPSMAILFLTFAMATGGTSVLDEQRRWTLQRIITTPTPRWVFMGGKLLGIYFTGVAQMVVLIGATSVVARLLGREGAVWGTNYAGLALLVAVVVLAATSLGLLIAAVSETPAQASTYSTVALFLLGMLGGSFIPIEGLPGFLGWLPKITLNYWGIQGFFDMAFYEASVADLATNLLVLAGMAVVFFVISLWRFSRRLDI